MVSHRVSDRTEQVQTVCVLCVGHSRSLSLVVVMFCGGKNTTGGFDIRGDGGNSRDGDMMT